MQRLLGVQLALLASVAPVAGQALTTGFLDRVVELDGVAYRYQVYVPRAYDAAERWPVILFLHGAGERGSDGMIQTEVGLGSAIRRFPERYPAVVVFPQAPEDSSWQGTPGRMALAALDQTLAEVNADLERMYLTGLSMGGNGTWYLGHQHAERFAAMAVVCGFVRSTRSFGSFVPPGEGTPYERFARGLQSIPTWIVHGADDPVVPVTESQRMFEALTAVDADVHYVELPGVGHNAWDAAYRSPEFPVWLLQQRKR